MRSRRARRAVQAGRRQAHRRSLADALRRAVGERPTSLTHVSLSWNGASWPLRHPLDYLGSDGGGGVGGGPGISVGAALALKGSGRLPIAVCGDGDFLMGVTALWTAAHYRIPLLMVIANNRSFFNDELHQERVARMRNRPVENRWVGQRISEPDIDLAAMARAQGAQGFGPVERDRRLAPTFAQAIAAVEAGGVAVVDVRVEPGYSRRHHRGHDPQERMTMAETAPSRDAILTVDDIVVRFETAEGPITAVDDVSFEVRPGEFLSVIGPSGCGKSTLFNVIGGLLTITMPAWSASPARPSTARTNRSAWCSRRNRPSPGATSPTMSPSRSS